MQKKMHKNMERNLTRQYCVLTTDARFAWHLLRTDVKFTW